MDSKVKYWVDIAEYDLDTAKALMETKRYLYVGFMCNQVIEKSLKAVIAESGTFPPKIHTLPVLADKAELTVKMSNDQIKFIASLNPLNIEARYPKYKDKINEMLTPKMCEKILNDTEEMFQWIKQQLK